jgi:DNA-binding NtrC family response regulator
VVLDNPARAVLERYPWPGNIRELKNIAEQVSVLSSDKVVTAEDLQRFLPEISRRNLPVLASEGAGAREGLDEREILYKVLFEMRRDINDLKRFVWQLAQGEGPVHSEDLQLPAHLLPEEARPGAGSAAAGLEALRPEGATPPPPRPSAEGPIVIEQGHYDEETVEESLSIADKEKELIQLALRKHKGKRKDAALDLGISERTLYRKIKEYAIHE